MSKRDDEDDRMPWVRLIPGRWLKGTSNLTPGEAGIYITLVVLMYEREGPVENDTADLRRHCRVPEATARRLVDSLIQLKKVILLPDGRLWDDRVEKELARRSEKRKQAQKNARSSRGKKASKTNGPAERPHSGRRANKSKNQSQTLFDPIGSILPDDVGPSVDDEFAIWYRAYPLKTGKGQAKLAFAKARKKTSLQDLLDGVERYKRDKPPDRHWRYPATWLNGEGWLDEAEPPLPASRSPPAAGAAPEKEREEWAAAFANVAKRKTGNG